MKKIFLIFGLLLAAITPACAIDVPAPGTSDTEQRLCNTQVGNPDCPGQCVPLNQCLDEDLYEGTCCPHFKHPYTHPIYEIHCGTNMDGNGECISTNRYFDGTVFEIECVTVTTWYPPNAEQGQQTDCRYY